MTVSLQIWRKGIGKAPIRNGLALLQKRGAQGCVLVGAPHYYGRFGFRQNLDLIFNGVPQEYFLALLFGSAKAQGVETFHQGFSTQYVIYEKITRKRHAENISAT